MAAPIISFGALVTLEELTSASQHFKEGASLRVTGKLQDYNVETAIAIINDGAATLKVDTQHLKINFRMSSIYQFIGELHFDSPDEVVLKARVGRNVDGIDLNLYHQSIKLLQEFQSDQIRKQAP
ncbi:hypothetical protein DCAR_0935422 [Daucus carota subsp. sativus]|uniref:Uncharacterized protein n=1 Tax=Daucus carota subsp. sativus TaxID=79200 RepID=A0A175YGX0_DAUCS|nr:PREDICTED: CST complex subunit TEN1 [Daucus carota subsp. sativus]XP_017224526.1 PREDICTED: CST complex subunit TEN1 [Daucus carota subsp. sativus]WOH15876.1 hypothetical protein DCAR_0935422 [Daucus carota subsp. sativus]